MFMTHSLQDFHREEAVSEVVAVATGVASAAGVAVEETGAVSVEEEVSSKCYFVCNFLFRDVASIFRVPGGCLHN